jgi:molecular chaperone GrpE
MKEKEIPVEITPPEGGSAGNGPLSDNSAQLDAVVLERDQLEEQRALLEREKTELSQRLLRLAAEFDNFRKRSDREKAESSEFGATDAVKAMLPVLDDFERALRIENSGSEFARGMELIYQRMYDALRKLGLEPIDSVGKPFDPNVHYAIDHETSPDVETDTVKSEYQRGYTFKGRLLRPAMVHVVTKA